MSEGSFLWDNNKNSQLFHWISFTFGSLSTRTWTLSETKSKHRHKTDHLIQSDALSLLVIKFCFQLNWIELKCRFVCGSFDLFIKMNTFEYYTYCVNHRQFARVWALNVHAEHLYKSTKDLRLLLKHTRTLQHYKTWIEIKMVQIWCQIMRLCWVKRWWPLTWLDLTLLETKKLGNVAKLFCLLNQSFVVADKCLRMKHIEFGSFFSIAS